MSTKKKVKPNPEPPPEVRVPKGNTLQLIEISKLEVDRSYQREILTILDKIMGILLIANAFGYPIVAKRPNGRYFVIDGQQRIEKARRDGFTHVWVDVIEVPDYGETEAQLFVVLNCNRKNLRALEEFHGRVKAGEERAIALKAVAAGYGFIIPRTDKVNRGMCLTKRSYLIRAIGTLQWGASLRVGHMAHVIFVLDTLSQLWRNNPDRTKSIILEGLFGLWLNSGGTVQVKQAVKTLSATTPTDLMDNIGRCTTSRRTSAAAEFAAWYEGKKTAESEKKRKEEEGKAKCGR